MSHARALGVLALIALLPAGATLYFFLFWRWFEFWRKHRVLTYTMMLATFTALAAGLYVFRRSVFALQIGFPEWVNWLGWAVIALSSALGFVADRQIGIRVRAFTPFFEQHGRIELKTTGAYGVVRHPIYASGIYFQLGVFLVTGYVAVLGALFVFALGASW